MPQLTNTFQIQPIHRELAAEYMCGAVAKSVGASVQDSLA